MPHVRDRIWTEYLEWLLWRVGFSRIRRHDQYSMLMEQLLHSPFEYPIERDKNRASDGLSLRDDFFSDSGIRGSFEDEECKVLEMLIAFAIRIENDYIGDPAEERPERIFWEMICNLGLDRFDDRHFNQDYIFERLGTWIQRKFKRNGEGSIFPLRHPHADQREIEIWSQMNEYLSENYS